MKKYHFGLIIAFSIVWVWSAINPVFPHDWLIENYLIFFFVPLILIFGYYFKLSKVSYTLITLFLILHVIGSHYTYSEVPFGDTLQNWLGAERNMYDRMVHFCFGFLLFYPVREVFMRLAKVEGFWAYLLPIDLVGSLSAIYEIVEWLAVRAVSNPAAGVAFLGSQGDIWDAQKDMLMALTGSAVAALIVIGINWYGRKNFWKEMKKSFMLPRGDHMLGEEEWKKMFNK
jgi:putative membrane protein